MRILIQSLKTGLEIIFGTVMAIGYVTILALGGLVLGSYLIAVLVLNSLKDWMQVKLKSYFRG